MQARTKVLEQEVEKNEHIKSVLQERDMEHEQSALEKIKEVKQKAAHIMNIESSLHRCVLNICYKVSEP